MTRWFIDPVGNIFLLTLFKHLSTPNIVNALDGVKHSLGSDMLQHSSVLFLFDMCLIDPLRWSVARRRDAEFVLSELRLSSFPVSLLGDRVLSFGLPVNTTRTHDVTWLLLRCDYYITVFRSRNNTADTGGGKKNTIFCTGTNKNTISVPIIYAAHNITQVRCHDFGPKHVHTHDTNAG